MITAWLIEVTTPPVTIPSSAPSLTTVAIAELPVLHTPPAVASLSVIVDPAHTSNGPPVIAAGSGFTVIVVVVLQPVIGKV